MTLVAVKWSSLKSVSITCSKVRTRDRYLVHERQHFFGNIVGGVRMPPWGVPSFVTKKEDRSRYPAFSHFLSIPFSMGMWATTHSCEIRSKQERISPSSIHCARSFLHSAMKQASIASAAERPRRNPYELGSAVVSATGSRASKYKACIALSRMVGIFTAHYPL